MYAYIDESGNTGGNLQDSNQPFFYHMALLSEDNLDKEEDFQKILTKFNLQELHGSRQKNLIESYALDLLTILKKHNTHFFFHCTEKKIFAYIKLFEAIFDSAENKYSNFIIYKEKKTRFALLCYFIDTIDSNIAFDFYNKCTLEIDEEKATKNFTKICQEAFFCIKKGKVNPINSYMVNVIRGALQDTTNLSICSNRDNKKYNIPNLFDWMNLLNNISQYVINKKDSIDKIIHDNQHKFMESIRDVYSFCARLGENNAVLNFGSFGKIAYSAYSQNRDIFDFKNSYQSFGIQATDVCLFIFSHLEKYKESKNTKQLIHFITERCDSFCTNRDVLFKESDMNFLIKYLKNI